MGVEGEGSSVDLDVKNIGTGVGGAVVLWGTSYTALLRLNQGKLGGMVVVVVGLLMNGPISKLKRTANANYVQL